MTGYDKVRKGYKWEVLALLWVAYLLNQADRQVFNVVLPLIREDLGLSDVAVGPDRRIYRRPFQPQVDRDGERPLLERRHHVHGTLQRIPDAGRDAQHRNGRRRSLLRACELLAHRRLPRPDASLRHVDPPDGLLCRDHPQRVCRRRRRRTLGLAQRLLHLRRHRGSPRHNHGRTLARPQTSCDRADRKRGGGTSRNPVSPKDSASFSRLRRHSF